MAKKDGTKARTRSERFEVEETMTMSDVASYLEGIARGLREGTVVIGGETEGFRASVASDVELEVEARHGKRKSRIALTLAFRGDAPDGAVHAGPVEAPAAEEQSAATMPDEMSF
jgi:amphi-Trp domain-containing protein